MACTNCNGSFSDCTTQCTNPCGVSQLNTPACESLPSQIQNFTTQFFGEVIKTEVDGAVVWSLPCSLETGLPNNPRGASEGLACYFLRLFRDGIGGLTGPRGLPGVPGTDGKNAYSVVIQSFGQPNLSAPLTQIVVVENPVFVEGLTIFVQYSGYYLITNVAPGGVLFVTLLSPLGSAPATIPSGSVVIPAGPPGLQGIQGPVGMGVMSENGCYSTQSIAGIAPYGITNGWAQVHFNTTTPLFTPLGAGTYLVTTVASLTGLATIATSDVINTQLRSSDGTIYYQSLSYISNLVPNQYISVPMTCIIQTTGTPGQQVVLFAKTTGIFGSVVIDYLGTTLTWVRIA